MTSNPKETARLLRKNTTPCERHLWQLLRRKQLNYRILRQYVFYYKLPNENFNRHFFFDFFCPKAKLAIELDGKYHEENIAYDQERDTIAKAHQIETLRIPNEWLWEAPDKVLALIEASIYNRLEHIQS